MVKIIHPLHIPEDKPKEGRLAWWVENTLLRTAKRVINDTSDTIREIFSFSITDFVEDFEKDLIELVRPFADYVLSTPALPAFIRKPIKEAMTGKRQAGVMVIGGLAVGLMAAILSGVSKPVGEKIGQYVSALVKPALLDPGALVALWRRDLISKQRLKTTLSYHGYSPEAQTAVMAASDKLIDESLLTQANWRELISRHELVTQLEHRGFTPKEISLWLTAREVIPSPQELISMAVREAFNDKIAAQFGYDEGFPTEAAGWAKKQGMSVEWFRRAWRAHWTLPGINQVREMRNRGIILDDDVDSFLVAADIPIFWRTALKKYMYSEVTRVDLRRMYALGVINIDEVYERYLKIGYTPEDAKKLQEWTEKEYLDKERELTKSDILTMYQSGLLNEVEATTYLTDLDYQPEHIALLLAHRDLKREEAYESKVISNTRKLFLKGIYNRTDVYSIMGVLDTPGNFVEETLRVWDLEKKGQIAVPSVTQFRDMVLGKVISEEDFRVELTNKGYKPVSIDRYIGLWFRGEEE